MDIKELIERVRLTDEEIDEAVVVNTDSFTHNMIKNRVIAKAQLNKVLNDPDLYVIDGDQTAPCSGLHENSLKGMITQDYLNGRESMTEAGFKKVIPLREAMKEANNGH